MSYCEFVTFPLVSWVRCGTWFYYIPTKIHIDTNYFPTQKYKILYHPTSVFWSRITILHSLPTSNYLHLYCIWVKPSGNGPESESNINNCHFSYCSSLFKLVGKKDTTVVCTLDVTNDVIYMRWRCIILLSSTGAARGTKMKNYRKLNNFGTKMFLMVYSNTPRPYSQWLNSVIY